MTFKNIYDPCYLISTAYIFHGDPSDFSAMECGAVADDIYGPETYASNIHTANWIIQGKNVWIVEANPRNYTAIQQQHNQTLNFALSDHTGYLEFYEVQHAGWGYSEEALSNDAIDQSEDILLTFKVPCTTYNEIQNIADTIFDVLILDIEGAEELVLKNMQHLPTERLPKVLCIECGLEWERRKSFVNNLGYELDFYHYNNAYFSLPNSVSKNTMQIHDYNIDWPEFKYGNKLIYKNERLQ